MKIGIYNEPAAGLGGSEYLVAVIAAALAEQHEVEIVHHLPSLHVGSLATYSGLDLRAVGLRYVERAQRSDAEPRSRWRRHREYGAWQARLSKPYDLFVAVTHGVPPVSYARAGVLLVLFPAADRKAIWPFSVSASSPRAWLRRAYYEWDWGRRFASYQLRTAISEFTREWAKRWWGIDSVVVYPPVDTRFGPAEKSDIILSVGRFTGARRSKRQLEMVGAFGELKRAALREWQYVSAGALHDLPQDGAYFEQVSCLAAASDARLVANAERAQLRDFYQRAKIFWHAAGYGDDADSNPYAMEHFGIATVEAMAAGCVPVVIDRGGQPEIVEHGVSGFLWGTLGELREHTLRLARDDRLRARMADAARARAAEFDRERFVQRFLGVLRPVLRP